MPETDPGLDLNYETDQLIDRALQEDLGDGGDITSTTLLDAKETGRATIVAKQQGVIAGLPLAQRVFEKVDQELSFQALIKEGENVSCGDRVALVEGPIVSILTAERNALNFLQRLSGIASLTAKFVRETSSTNARILDTRKTTPGMRSLEKYAVRVGGGQNHRMGLFDMVMIKDNHIAAAGGITPAVKRIRAVILSKNLDLKIEVESTTLDQVKEAKNLSIDRIMLDNFSISQIREAVKVVSDEIELEVSGGVTLETVREIAETGVDYISVGALTHSPPALDLSLLIESA